MDMNDKIVFTDKDKEELEATGQTAGGSPGQRPV